jgi:hypothetical protein
MVSEEERLDSKGGIPIDGKGELILGDVSRCLPANG